MIDQREHAHRGLHGLSRADLDPLSNERTTPFPISSQAYVVQQFVVGRAVPLVVQARVRELAHAAHRRRRAAARSKGVRYQIRPAHTWVLDISYRPASLNPRIALRTEVFASLSLPPGPRIPRRVS